MSLKITLTIDQENEQGTVLIGLLAKALGRGEAGVSDLRIEREGEVARPPALRAIRQSTIAKLAAARTKGKKPASPALMAAAKLRAAGAFPGMRAVTSGKPNGVSVTLRALKLEGSREGIRAMFGAHKLNPNGLGSILSKLQQRGFIKRVGDGEYRLTPQGEELEARVNAKVEHHDSASD